MAVEGDISEHPQNRPEFKVIDRVTRYGPVSSAIERAQSYYRWGKEYSPTLFMYVESGVGGSVNWLAPKVESVLNADTTKHYVKTVDDFGCQKLDSLETTVKSFNDRFQSSKDKLSTKLVEVQDHYITPVDSYLRESYVGKPFNLALDATEMVVDRILPEENEEKEKQKQERREGEGEGEEQGSIGPVYRATKVSKKVQSRAFAKLNNLALRTPEKLRSFHHTVDLIQYAADAIDQGAHTTSQFLESSYDRAATGARVVYEFPSRIKSQVGERMQVVRRDVVTALHTAVDTLSKSIPEPVTERIARLRERAHTDWVAVSSKAKQSSDTLREVGSTLSYYIHHGEEIPTKILANCRNKIQQVIAVLSQNRVQESESEEESQEKKAHSKEANTVLFASVLRGYL